MYRGDNKLTLPEDLKVNSQLIFLVLIYNLCIWFIWFKLLFFCYDFSIKDSINKRLL